MELGRFGRSGSRCRSQWFVRQQVAGIQMQRILKEEEASYLSPSSSSHHSNSPITQPSVHPLPILERCDSSLIFRAFSSLSSLFLSPAELHVSDIQSLTPLTCLLFLRCSSLLSSHPNRSGQIAGHEPGSAGSFYVRSKPTQLCVGLLQS